MSDYRHIRLATEERVAAVTLCRPPLNIMNMEMMEELVHAFDSLGQEKHLNALVIRAEGKAFCAGAAVEDHVGDKTVPFIKLFHQVFRSMIALPCPAVAVVDGAALGGGCELATFCDLVVATERAKFGQPEIHLGVFAPVSVVSLPWMISYQRMMELMLTGESVSADKAYEWGFVNRLVPSDEVDRHVDQLLSLLRGKSALALRTTRKAIRDAMAVSFHKAIDKVERTYLEHIESDDAQEGLYSFLEKRQPKWTDK